MIIIVYPRKKKDADNSIPLIISDQRTTSSTKHMLKHTMTHSCSVLPDIPELQLLKPKTDSEKTQDRNRKRRGRKRERSEREPETLVAQQDLSTGF